MSTGCTTLKGLDELAPISSTAWGLARLLGLPSLVGLLGGCIRLSDRSAFLLRAAELGISPLAAALLNPLALVHKDVVHQAAQVVEAGIIGTAVSSVSSRRPGVQASTHILLQEIAVFRIG